MLGFEPPCQSPLHTDAAAHRLPLRDRGHRRYCGYVIAGIFNPLLADRYPFAFYFVAIVVAGWMGGLGPALVALVLGYLAADWFFLSSDGLLSIGVIHPTDWGGSAIYFAAGLSIVALAEAMRRAEAPPKPRRRSSTSSSRG